MIRCGAALVLWLSAAVALAETVPPSSAPSPAPEAKSPAAAETRLPLTGKDGARPNVLLLTIDTLRTDHLGAYGYRLDTSPAIDRLAEDGVVFTDAITPVPQTAPAIASLLTGLHVDGHRVHANVGSFAEDASSLGEAFASAGYDTAGFYGNEAIEEFGRGFAVWEEFPRKVARRGRELADDLGVERGLEWLEQAKEPWFLWLHFIDPHGPYDSSPPERSAGFDYPDDPALTREIQTSDENWVFGAVPQYQTMPGARHVVDYVRRYDGEIVGTDLQVKRILDRLREENLLDHTLVVLTADHGESLIEDDYYFQHGRLLNEASLRVPLILRHAALPAGTKVDAPVSLVDLYPTLAALVGLPAPEGVAGRDVSGAIFGAAPAETLRIAYTVTPNLKVSVQRGPWRLEGTPAKEGRVRRIDRFQRVVLYDASRRPERIVPPRKHPETVDELREELTATSLRLRSRGAPTAEVTEEQKARLRAMGYLD